MVVKLEGWNFICCYRCCRMNLKYDTRLGSEFVVLDNIIELKVIRSIRKEVQNAFVDYYSKK